MNHLFFSHGRTILENPPDFSNLAFPPLCTIETHDTILAHGVFIGKNLIASNTLLLPARKYFVRFSNGYIGESTVSHRVPFLGLCYLGCPATPTLPHFRKRHEVIHEDTFVFDLSIAPDTQVGLSFAGKTPETFFGSDTLDTTQNCRSGAVLFDRHGEILGMRVSQIKNQDFFVNAHINDILRIGYGTKKRR